MKSTRTNTKFNQRPAYTSWQATHQLAITATVFLQQSTADVNIPGSCIGIPQDCTCKCRRDSNGYPRIQRLRERKLRAPPNPKALETLFVSSWQPTALNILSLIISCALRKRERDIVLYSNRFSNV